MSTVKSDIEIARAAKMKPYKKFLLVLMFLMKLAHIVLWEDILQKLNLNT